DQEVVQGQLVDELVEAVAEPVDVVALPEDAGDLAGLDAGGDQVDRATGGSHGRGSDGVGSVLDGALAPQVVVEGAVDRVLVEVEDDVDARRLDVGVDDAGPGPA